MDNIIKMVKHLNIDHNSPHTREGLFALGKFLIIKFCKVNNLPVPVIKTGDTSTRIGRHGRGAVYGYYQHDYRNQIAGYIAINVQYCKLPVYNAIFQLPIKQSYPGNKADRTVIGVLAHEFGHYIDFNTPYHLWSQFSKLTERSVTSYDTTPVERVAEAMRLFLLNPDLLAKGRPQAYSILSNIFKPVQNYPWEMAFDGSVNPQVYVEWCNGWIKQGNKKPRHFKL